MAQKFRSLEAFRRFEQGTLGQPRTELVIDGDLSPLKVLGAIKRHPKGIARAALASELNASPQALEQAVLMLLNEALVRIEAGETPEEDLLLTS